ncbi:glycosyltransferase [Ochrovirga pacifica]|uniref:glycosyltransferase n=1 Tax=Ochrovirga pacifica TaxID=1042376 RepID=UPI0002559DA0|nr:glycosyltransferase [Ochrovirga pacifica]
MKLAIVTAYPPSKITLNEYAYHLVKSFRQHQELSELILLTDTTTEPKDLDFKESGCKITVKECWEFNSYGNIKTVKKAVKETKPDAVLFNLQFMKFGDKKVVAAMGLMLPWFLKMKKIPTMVLLHNIMEEVDLGTAGFTSNKLMQSIYGFIGTTLTKLILQADMVAVTIKKYVDVLTAKYKVNNVILIPHGTFEIPETPTYHTPEGPLQIMAFGKFGTYKKVEMMIEAVEMIRKRTNLDLEVVIAGTDNPNVPGYLAGVQEQYKNVSGLRFTGYVEENQVAPLFQNSAVVVFPYTSTTGSSGVLHQAGSYGKAVVMPDLGDLALLIKDEGYKGEFFNPTDVSSLADAIQKIAEDQSYRIALGKANYQAATAYPMTTIADMYVQNFKKIKSKG